MSLKTIERDDLLRRIARLNEQVDKINRMLKGEQIGTARIADAAITNAKITTITWDKAQGGTAILGGVDNISGVLQIKDSDGNLILTLDENGMTYSDGVTNIARFGKWEE